MENRKELFALIEANPEKAQEVITFEILLKMDEIAEHLRTLANSVSGREGYRPYDPVLAPAPNRLADVLEKLIEIMGRKQP